MYLKGGVVDEVLGDLGLSALHQVWVVAALPQLHCEICQAGT